MSQVEPKEKPSIPEGWEQVGTARNGAPIVSDGRHRKILANGGLLNADGNPGNKGGGRIADKVRLDATQSLESEVKRIGGLLTLLVDRAELELEDSGRLDAAIQSLNTISRIANTLTSIGPGTKVTNVVESSDWIGFTREAMEDSGIDPELVTLALKKLEARISG